MGALVPTMQGFMIRVSNPGIAGYQAIGSSLKRLGDPGFYRATNQGWFTEQLVLNVVGNGFADKTTVYFHNGPTAGWDAGFDAYKFNSNHNQPTVFTNIAGETENISINGLPLLSAPVSIPMGLLPGSDGSFVLKANGLETFDESVLIFLEDQLQNNVQCLQVDSGFNFSASVLDAADRFKIHFLPPVQVTAFPTDCQGENGRLEVRAFSMMASGNFLGWNTFSLEDSEGNQVASGAITNNLWNIASLPGGHYTLTFSKGNYHAVAEVDVEVPDPVAADFQFILNGNVCQFQNLSTGAFDYSWNFGDGQISNLENPQHTFSQPGNYTVQLLARNRDCDNLIEQNIALPITTFATEHAEIEAIILSGAGGKQILLRGLDSGETAYVQVADLLGKIVYETDLETHSGSVILDLHHLADAQYMISIHTRQTLFNARLVLAE